MDWRTDVLGDVKDLLEKLNSKSDWFVVGTAALIGFVLDASIDIAPLPIFSPGTCGLTAAGAALTAKRGWEAVQESAAQTRLLNLYSEEISRLLRSARERQGSTQAEREVSFDFDVARERKDVTALDAVLKRARDL